MANRQYKAKVKFGNDCKDKQRNFLLAMSGNELIKVSKDWIDIWYTDESVFHPDGYENEIILHSEKELNCFKLVMNTFFSDDPYTIDAFETPT